MSRVVSNNRGFLQLLADCPPYQRQFLLKTATPQQLHALVQVLYNMLKGHIPISKENKRILLPYKDALLNLARSNVPYKTKKRVLVQEGSGFIENVLAPSLRASSLGGGGWEGERGESLQRCLRNLNAAPNTPRVSLLT